MSRPPFARYRELLAAAGFRPSRRLGQNFLLDPSLHRAIVDAAAPCPQDVVLEVGVGLGFLTRELLPRAGAVVGVEVDPRLLAIARSELEAKEEGPGSGAARAELVLVGTDVLGRDGELHEEVTAALHRARSARPAGRLLVVANLPYAVSGPFLAAVAGHDELPERLVVLVQRELGQRIAATAGSAEYGALSALLQALYTVAGRRRVGREVFRPRPRVDSALVELGRREDLAGGWSRAERRALRGFLRALFAQRRKTLRANLANLARGAGREAAPGPEGGVVAPAGPPELPELPELSRRAQELDPEALLALWEKLAPWRDGTPGKKPGRTGQTRP